LVAPTRRVQSTHADRQRPIEIGGFYHLRIDRRRIAGVVGRQGLSPLSEDDLPHPRGIEPIVDAGVVVRNHYVKRPSSSGAICVMLKLVVRDQ
jgi:hypothetical protein